ncbi:LPS assembly lipoprotein LptE [Coraliomargarita akajimensis]|uniref:Lipoprotein n=1 Tax=Coraliomargarita akajimensis (strain DSM 45221 / IAM 15411 / JCM 23193 / KCTC 12865 / 04OKA010-24) TaxID=583355 RepID=D5ERB6_CORAD|nr:LPS assembly lipoprotein LptE [Coraliomargarita akajimensis]ADE55960.1 conserved hypothetical protein [Coraliomargarita akajimensis DSM 45221]
MQVSAHIRLLSLSLLGLAAIAISGCASYKMGSSAPIPFETLYVEATANESFAPQAQAAVSAKIRDTFIRDGRVQLVNSPKKADAILSITLTDYRRTGNTRNPNDTVRAQDFTITLQAEASLYDNETQQFLFEKRQLSENTSAYAGNPYDKTGTPDQTQSYFQAEYQAMPTLARGLARQITDTVLSTW